MVDIVSLDQRWRLLVPDGTVLVHTTAGHDAVARLRELAPQTIVALTGGPRLRRLARRAGVRVRAEYLALPSLANPVAITQRTRGPITWTARSLLTVPSGVTRMHAPLWVAIRVIKSVPSLLTRSRRGDWLLVGVRE